MNIFNINRSNIKNTRLKYFVLFMYKLIDLINFCIVSAYFSIFELYIQFVIIVTMKIVEIDIYLFKKCV